MTENKRFKICIDSNNFKSLWDDERTEEEPLLCLNRFDRISGIDDCCELLNELAEENEQLKSELKALRKKYNDFSDAVDKRLKELRIE